ncbi:MAG: MotA/TolQ/ExbB proton channel family protein [Syntrophotaleaceae bacterium]
MQSMMAFLTKAGPIGVAIIGCSVIALFIIVERVWVFRQLRLKDPRLMHRVGKRAAEGNLAQAVALVQEEKHAVAQTISQMLARLENAKQISRADLEKVAGHAASREVRLMERFLPTLQLVANISPLLGLFGTVTGMIKAFQAIQSLGGKVNASVLAGGIWEAMLTTALGLGVAIPAMVAHNYLQGKVHAVVAEIKEESGTLLDALEQAGRLSVSGGTASACELKGASQEVG